MLKKILILVLALNTLYTLPSESSSNPKFDPKFDLAMSCLCTASGMICSWLAYKGVKKWMQAEKERDQQLKIINEIGPKVYETSTCEYVGWRGSFVTKKQYSMDIPSSFSQQQVEEANEHWSLFLANDKYADNMICLAVLAGLGGLILTPIGIVELFNKQIF